jgi:signal transduction histidine kinase
VAAWWRGHRPSLATQFMLLNLVILVVGMLALGTWVGREIETGVLTRTGTITALYVESFVEPSLTTLEKNPALDEAGIAALDRLLSDTALGERVVAFRIWSPDGVILYSPNHALIGRQFPIDEGLERSLGGEVSAELTDLEQAENEMERGQFSELLEVYAPVRARWGGRIIAVTELYQQTDALEQEIADARRRSWGAVAGVMILSYVLVAGLVKRGSDTIARQQMALRQQVSTLSSLLDQNARLGARVAQAARRTTTLNEQVLRRIGSDLHDGPGQVLALALLRIDSLREQLDGALPRACAPDFETVHEAVREALTEVRQIAAGLRLPDLEARSVEAVAERAVHDHQRRAGTSVRLEVAPDVPEQAPLAVKIALLRSVQEALSNATRHGEGRDVSVRVWLDGSMLCLAVSDQGPGFVPERAEMEQTGHLGLAGMRERAELLGGTFQVRAAPGRGAIVQACWPLAEREGAWLTQSA